RLAAYTFFAEVGRAVQDWHLGQEGACDASAEDPPSAARPSDAGAGALRQSARTAGCVIDDGGIRQLGPSSRQSHPLAGVGKLFAALALADRAQVDPDLLELTVRVQRQHREQAAVGPLRTHTGDLSLTLGDAVGLILSTSDAAAS